MAPGNRRNKELLTEFLILFTKQPNLALLAIALINWWSTGRCLWLRYFVLLEIVYFSLWIRPAPFPGLAQKIIRSLKLPHREPLEWQTVSSWLVLAMGIGLSTLNPAYRLHLAGESISRAYGRWEVAALV